MILDQNRRLHRLRELLAVEAPRAGHVPRWFLGRARALLVVNGVFPKYGDTLSVVSRLDEIFANGRLFDHFGSLERGNVLACEPYPSARVIQAAIALADELRIRVEISAASWWNPPETIRVSFREHEETA